MKSGFILFALIFFITHGEAHAGLEYKILPDGKCHMLDEGKVMRKVSSSLCAPVGENNTSYNSLNNSSRYSEKETGRSPSLEVFYRRRASHQ